MNFRSAARLKCSQRDAKLTQLKHHWWWKASEVFDRLEATRSYRGLVLFFEDDHYVTKDVLQALNLMQKQAKIMCPQCNIFTLGDPTESIQSYASTNRNGVTMNLPFDPTFHQHGLIFY